MGAVIDPAARLMPQGRYEWERIVRRIVMPPQHKLVALLLATWADPDGTRVRPGMELLASATNRSLRTVGDIVRSLWRDWGLIDQTERGGGRGRGGKTATYRLTIPTDLIDRHTLLDPDGKPFSSAVQVADQSESDTDRSATQGSGQSAPHPVDNSDPSEAQASGQSDHAPVDSLHPSATQTADENEFHRKYDTVTNELTGNFQQLIGNSALPTTTHITKPPTTNTPPELPTQPPEGTPAPVDKPIPHPRPTLDELLPLARPPRPPRGPKCRHGLAAGRQPDGSPRCPLCRRDAVTNSIPHPLTHTALTPTPELR